MSLLQNEDFVLYQLRTSYLSHIKDGVGERLITVNANVLNNPAFRAAGWLPNASDIKRTYSPPIPTAIASEYFQAPKSAGLTRPGFGDEEEEGGMVTGVGGSNDTVGPTLDAKRKRRKQLLEEDDSSDLSDDSDEDNESTQRPLNQIKFTKMPVRTRAGSSPLRSTNGPSLLVTSPSRPPENSRLRRGSLGAVEAVKERARRDTVTSSEMSSENELDPSLFKRKQINPRRAVKASHFLSERIQEDERESQVHIADADAGAESDSTLSSELAGTADTNSLLGVPNPLNSSPPATLNLPNIPPPMTPLNTSPKKQKQQISTPIFHDLPPPRPISMVQPVSALTQALKAEGKAPVNPFQRFATLTGKEDPNPLYLKIYVPFSKSSKPFEMPIRRKSDDGNKVTVAEAIGLALWMYGEQKLEPPIKEDKMNVNWWTMRMVDDGEVDLDFLPLVRTRPIVDFASNNNRTMRGRSRDKPWDEFGLVEAKESEFKSNEEATPDYSTQASEALEQKQNHSRASTPTTPGPPTPTPPIAAARGPPPNPITGLNFAPAGIRKDSTNLLDAPAAPVSHSTPRTGAPRTLTVRFLCDDFTTRTSTVEVTTDTYIAEVFDRVCRDFSVDKALYILKVSGTTTVAPSDRTVEALGERTALDLARRRFVGDGAFGLAGSPGSSSPNAPLEFTTAGTPKKGKRRGGAAGSGTPGMLHPLSERSDAFLTGNYKRWVVTRKQPMSFSSSSARILALDGEYMHIMPGEGGGGAKTLFEAPPKTTTVHFSSVIHSKVSRRHPRMFRVVVFKERESKRYDFEAGSHEEAKEIVREIEKGMERVNQESVI